MTTQPDTDITPPWPPPRRPGVRVQAHDKEALARADGRRRRDRGPDRHVGDQPRRHRRAGQEAVSAFFDSNIAKNNLRITCEGDLPVQLPDGSRTFWCCA